MKKIFSIIAFFVLLNQMPAIAQEIFVSSTFSHSSYNKFQNNIGFQIGYLHPSKLKNRLGFSFSQSFNYTDYNYTFSSGFDGRDYYSTVKPKNQRFKFSIDYTFDILNKDKSSIYIGPEIGLNYFKINESVIDRIVNEEYSYDNDYWEKNKIGIGLLLVYDRKVFSDNISVFVSTEPEVIFFSQSGIDGSSDPVLIRMINFNLGIKFNIKKI